MNSDKLLIIDKILCFTAGGIMEELPLTCATFWSAGDMAAHGIKMDLEQMTGLIPSTFQVVFILGIMAFVSFLLIDRLYKQRGE